MGMKYWSNNEYRRNSRHEIKGDAALVTLDGAEQKSYGLHVVQVNTVHSSRGGLEEGNSREVLWLS